MKRTTRNAEKTKLEIIERSASVFNIHGFAGTSMKMLVDATGFQMGGIYRHFATKQALAKAVFTYNYQTVVKPNLEFDPTLNPKQKLIKLIDGYKKMVVNPKIKGGCPILNIATEVDDTNEEFRALMASFMEETIKSIITVFEEGKLEGYFKPSIDSRKEALYLYATFEGAILLGKISRDISILMDVFDKLCSYLEHTIFIK